MKIFIDETTKGLGKEKNPNRAWVEIPPTEFGEFEALNPIWQEWEAEHPPLPVITQNGEVFTDVGSWDVEKITYSLSKNGDWVDAKFKNTPHLEVYQLTQPLTVKSVAEKIEAQKQVLTDGIAQLEALKINRKH